MARRKFCVVRSVVALSSVALIWGVSGCSRPVKKSTSPPDVVIARDLLEQARASPDVPVAYKALTMKERGALERALPELWELIASGGAASARLEEELGALDLTLEELDHSGQRWLLLREGGEAWRGAGGFLFRLGEVEHEVVLQAPHSFHDRGTGELAYEAFKATSVRGFFFNSLHRHHSYPKRQASTHPADLAHTTRSAFHSLSVSWLERFEAGRIVQLHGFDASGRRGDWDVILSVGVRSEVGVGLDRLRDRLIPLLGATARYPEDVRQLGATSNTLAKWCAARAPGRFVHVELSPAARARFGRHIVQVSRAIVID